MLVSLRAATVQLWSFNWPFCIQDLDLEEALEPDMEEDDDQKAVKDEL